MFASTHAFAAGSSSRQAMGALYQQVRVEAGVTQASPHELVAMLFDGFIEAVAQARGALREQRHEVKGLAIGRAVRIVEEGLRAGLDRRAGGTLARDLDELYAYLAMRLTLSNVRNDDAGLEECIRLMRPLQEAWAAIGDEARRLGGR